MQIHLFAAAAVLLLASCDDSGTQAQRASDSAGYECEEGDILISTAGKLAKKYPHGVCVTVTAPLAKGAH